MKTILATLTTLATLATLFLLYYITDQLIGAATALTSEMGDIK